MKTFFNVLIAMVLMFIMFTPETEAQRNKRGMIRFYNDYVKRDLQTATFGGLSGLVFTGNQTIQGTLTLGVDDTGFDFKLFTKTSGSYLLLDESTETLKLVGVGITVSAQTVTPDADSDAGSTILAGTISVDVATVTTNADDWIVLPSLASVPVGYTITIVCNAGTDFELRTPATDNEEINSIDCDGPLEYVMTDTEVVNVVKIDNTIGWMAHGYSAIGAVVTAVVPD